MSSSKVVVDWRRDGSVFLDNKYSREHTWSFDGGVIIRGSSSPDVVPIPFSNPACVDPEEAFVVALSSCHMLWFLSLAAAEGLIVDRYTDNASGQLSRSPNGRRTMTIVALRPRVSFAGDLKPTDQQVERLHDAAHHECFLANSVRCSIEVHGSWESHTQDPQEGDIHDARS